MGHKTANEALSLPNRLGHKVAVQARETTARTEAKFAPVEKKDPKGEAANLPRRTDRSLKVLRRGRLAPVTPPVR